MAEAAAVPSGGRQRLDEPDVSEAEQRPRRSVLAHTQVRGELANARDSDPVADRVDLGVLGDVLQRAPGHRAHLTPELPAARPVGHCPEAVGKLSSSRRRRAARGTRRVRPSVTTGKPSRPFVSRH